MPHLAPLPHPPPPASFSLYMECAASLAPLVADGGFPALRRLDLRKMLGVWKESSTGWLQGLVEALEARGSGGEAPEVLWG